MLHKWLTQGASVLSTEWANILYQVIWHILLFFIAIYDQILFFKCSSLKLQVVLGLWISFDPATTGTEANVSLPSNKKKTNSGDSYEA